MITKTLSPHSTRRLEANPGIVATGLLRMTGERISYGRWLLLGLPFALLSSFLSCWVITRLFLSRSERRMPIL